MQIYTFSPFGFDGQLISVQANLRSGISQTQIFGVSQVSDLINNMVIRETKNKTLASNLEYPPETNILSLSPADCPKDEQAIQFPIAMALQIEKHQLLQDSTKEKQLYPNEKVLVIGNLTETGQITRVKAMQNAIDLAHENGINHFIVPKGSELVFPENSKVLEAKNLKQAIDKCEKIENFISIESQEQKQTDEIQFTDIKDIFPNKNDGEYNEQIHKEYLERNCDTIKLIEVAIAGKHNLLLTGSPGCGKTVLPKMLIPIFTPKLTDSEAKTVLKIKNLAGFDDGLKKTPPFCTPHTNISLEDMIGGKRFCEPGEAILAHNGTLFLDEAQEFRSSVLQALHIPLNNKEIKISRAGRHTIYPADFQLVVSMNSSPDGNYLADKRQTLNSPKTIEQYWHRYRSILNKIEIINYMDFENNKKFSGQDLSIDKMKQRIANAYRIQRQRGVFNSNLTTSQISQYCQLSEDSKKFYEKIIETNLPQENLYNLLKVSLTIANMDGRQQIQTNDLKQATNVCMNEKMKTILNTVFNYQIKDLSNEKMQKKSQEYMR